MRLLAVMEIGLVALYVVGGGLYTLYDMRRSERRRADVWAIQRKLAGV
jgi:hypothetical protein